jgi:hypothetical protein
MPAEGTGGDRRSTGSRFPAYDHPVDAAQVHPVQWTQERFNAKKLGLCAGSLQVLDAEQVVLIFNTDSHPDLGLPL